MSRSFRFALAWLVASATTAVAQNDADDSTADAAPVVAWQFDGKPEPGLSKPGQTEPGPRPPAYPTFPADNGARRFSPIVGQFTVEDADIPDGGLRFGKGDAITLEAWVSPSGVPNGGYSYVLGKGRNRRKGFPEQNQNYSLRLHGAAGEARVTFLFASRPESGKPAAWHRWTSSTGFVPDGLWHHVAVSFTFGDGQSIRGVVDGRAVTGKWDMGGATDRSPVTDADALTVGTGNGGGGGNSFSGRLDEVKVWRGIVPRDTLLGRYEHVPQPPPPPPVTRADVPAGTVLVQLCEAGIPAANAWPTVPPEATETYTETAFGFFAVPHKYVATGVRGDRPNPFLLRAAAVVPLPAGTHRILLRGRGSARLYVDGKRLLVTPFPKADSGGHGKVRTSDSYLNLGPDFRFAPPGNEETWATFAVPKAGDHFVVLETLVGGFTGKSNRRPELGETVAAISPEGSESWFLLGPDGAMVPYTDAGWEAYHAERAANLDAMNAERRASVRAEHADYWNRRRAAAADWLKNADPVPVPPMPTGFPANNPIDQFLAAKIARVAKQMAVAEKGTVAFHDDVLPVLEARCFACHAGEKARGGLRLDGRAAMLTGGDFDGPAIVPGQPDQSPLLARVTSPHDDEVMPPKGDRLTKAQITALETWVREGAIWPEVRPEPTELTPLTDDLTFLRRVTLDTVGVVPTLAEIDAFVADESPDRRANVIDKLLADPRWADHWMGYWLDVLAENPNILNPTLNNTGPFRWWLYETFRDNKPADLMVTELLRMQGSERFGGPAGFATATQNDVPFAAKGVVITSAFLGVQTKCARCHDAPGHSSTQEDLFNIAAMLGKKVTAVPATSSVPLDKIHAGGRKPLIQVTLKPGTKVEPAWPFAEFAPASVAETLAENPADPRDRLAAVVTAPQNERFAEVFVNRLWQRYMGRGLVDPVDDWEKGSPSHPALLKWLGRELVRSGYDIQHVARLILNSRAYQRETDRSRKATGVLYASPAPRRLSAEQIVDALFAATGKPFVVEEASLDIDGRRAQQSSISLGVPRRSWMLTSTSNERDRPSLSLPRIQAVCDVLTAFGWRAARQEPISVRDTDPNTLQPAILSNGTVGVWLTRLSDDHGVTALALEDRPLPEFVDALFLKLLTRHPSPDELAMYTAYLRAGYETRVRGPSPKVVGPREPEPYVSWSNHLDAKATLVRQAQEDAARRGDPPTDRLDPDWRSRLEDVLWALLNSPEFVFTR